MPQRLLQIDHLNERLGILAAPFMNSRAGRMHAARIHGHPGITHHGEAWGKIGALDGIEDEVRGKPVDPRFLNGLWKFA